MKFPRISSLFFRGLCVPYLLRTSKLLSMFSDSPRMRVTVMGGGGLCLNFFMGWGLLGVSDFLEAVL